MIMVVGNLTNKIEPDDLLKELFEDAGMDFDINYGASEEGFIHVITDYPNLTGIQHDFAHMGIRWFEIPHAGGVKIVADWTDYRPFKRLAKYS